MLKNSMGYPKKNSMGSCWVSSPPPPTKKKEKFSLAFFTFISQLSVLKT